MKKRFLFILLSLCVFRAEAYKFVIFTDQKNGQKAEEVKREFSTVYPFSTYKIDFEIVVLDPKELECRSQYNIERNIGCNDTKKLQQKALELGGDQAMVVKESNVYGGSGGSVPVMTTLAKPNLLIHEYLHTLGLCDEYEYKKEETELYCGDLVSVTPNQVVLNVQDSYVNDREARYIHNSKIPWYKRIISRTPITNTNGTRLGTGVVDSGQNAPANYSDSPLILAQPIGLYEGRTCRQSPKKIRTWQPGGTATIMDNLDAGMGGAMEVIVDDVLKSRGFKKKIEIDAVVTQERLKSVVGEGVAEVKQYREGVVDPSPQETVAIDDTSRSNKMPLLEWLTDFFRTIDSSVGR